MSRGFLLDTNIPSELTRPQPEVRVTRWLEDTGDELMYFSVISIGEICKGLIVHPEQHRRAWLRQWLDKDLRPWLADRILPVSEAIAERWGILDGKCQWQGITLNAPDGLIVATALEHDLTVVTRNVKHFEGLGVPFSIRGNCRSPVFSRVAPVVKARGFRVRVSGHALRDLDTPAVREVVRNPRGAEGVAAYRGFNSRTGSAAAHHVPDIRARHCPRPELFFLAERGPERRPGRGRRCTSSRR